MKKQVRRKIEGRLQTSGIGSEMDEETWQSATQQDLKLVT